jgi:5'-3' exonuclease
MTTWKTFIDGNSVGHAASHGAGKQQKLYAGGMETTAIYGLLRSMNVILRARTAAAPVVLWDGRSWRFERFPEYKAGRTANAKLIADREAYKKQRPAMARALNLLGVRQMIAGNMEADDLAAILTRDAVKKGHKVALITGDKDWLQLVEPGVTWVDHKTTPERKCNATDFHEFTGYATQKAFIHSKALQGDTGDNVVTRIGIGEKGAKDLLAVFPCVHSFQQMPLDEARDRYFLHHGKKLPGKCEALHTEAEVQARFEWARELMDLGHPSIPKPERITLSHTPLNRAGFEQFCGEHAFHSLLADMDRFLSPFVTLDKEFPKQ